MQSRGFDKLPVINNEGKFVGVISREGLLRQAARDIFLKLTQLCAALESALQICRLLVDNLQALATEDLTASHIYCGDFANCSVSREKT